LTFAAGLGQNYVLSETPDISSRNSSDERESSSNVQEQDAIVIQFRDSVARESLSDQRNPEKKLVATATHTSRGGKEMKVETAGVYFGGKVEASLRYKNLSPGSILAHIVVTSS
jgi:hypothetical protein